MENSFNNRDFEQFVKQNADQYRMFPSEKVWKNINNTLHTRRRWYGIGLASLIITTVTVTWVMLGSSGKKQQATATTLQTPVITAKNTITTPKNPEVIIAINSSITNKPVFFASPDNQQDHSSLAEVTVVPLTENRNDISEPTQSTQELVAALPLKIDRSLSSEPQAKLPAVSNSGKEIATLSPVITSGTSSTNEFAAGSSNINGNKNSVSEINENIQTEKIKEGYPLSIESVVNAYKNTRKAKRLLWQIYAAPVISYRRLDENKAFLNSVRSGSLTFSNAVYSDINNVVTHKPDMGLQLGFNAAYPVSKKLRLITGLQFNVSKYDIRAYSYHTEVATIALNSNSVNTSWVSTYSNYRNFGGNSPDWLRNLYISASMPVGAELQLTANKKKYVGISGNLQPTYILADKSYLISTDYQHYSEVPSLTRKWNLSSGFEIFAGNSTGKVNWRIGPQVRYQMLSSYKGKYPIKEHLFDFGLKLGLMLNK
jgi:hypothetical protein